MKYKHVHELYGFCDIQSNGEFNPKKGKLIKNIEYLSETPDGDLLQKDEKKVLLKIKKWELGYTKTVTYKANSSDENALLFKKYGAKEINLQDDSDIQKTFNNNKVIIVQRRQRGNAGSDAIGFYPLSTAEEVERFKKEYFNPKQVYVLESEILQKHGVFHKNAYICI